VTDVAAQPETLASGTCSFSTARWLLRWEGDELVLAPAPPSRGLTLWLVCVYFAFGIGWGVFAGRLAKDDRGVLLALGLLVATATSVVVLTVFRHLSRAEVRRGPVLCWNRATREFHLPRRNVRVGPADAPRLELFTGWKRIGRTLTRWSELDLVVTAPGRYERHNLLTGVTRLPRIADELSGATSTPLERLA
jgi:hypothetical protein